MNSRSVDIDMFYHLLDTVIEKFPLQSLDKMKSNRLPGQGVYFFFEDGETRLNGHNRVVRIGTHAITGTSKATLCGRLRNHKGSKNLTGNHRVSVFRKLIGLSLSNKYHLDFRYWGDRTKRGDKQIKISEEPLETKVSEYLHSMKFTVLEISCPTSKDNDRALIEKNTIALLSNYQRKSIDKSSASWLGSFSKDDKVMSSGLWNSDWVDKISIDDKYFDTFEHHLSKMGNWS